MSKTVVPATHTYKTDSMIPVVIGGENIYIDVKFSVFRQSYLLDRITVCECETHAEAIDFIADYKRLVTMDSGDVLVLADHTDRTEEVFDS